MAELTPDNMARKLQAEGFTRPRPTADRLSDPIADTPMTVTLDQLRPYDLNPRVTRNPRYDAIKSSIRERGLDAPPPITRRPNDTAYMIRNGGNTRLAILRELWAETEDERFFRIPCLFRPWTARGEIVALTGHLAENELHGGLTLIERALGIEKARTLYEQETGQSLSQSALARRLTADGYPISQSHLSRLQDAVRYLLPAIPTVLYAGLGRPQVERLATLRKAGERLWETYATDPHPAAAFPDLFQEVLGAFDSAPEAFSIEAVQDELIGQMAERLDADYDVLALALDQTERRHRILRQAPADIGPHFKAGTRPSQAPSARVDESQSKPAAQPSTATDTAPADKPATTSQPTLSIPRKAGAQQNSDPHTPIVSPTPEQEPLRSGPARTNDTMGGACPLVETTALRSAYVQADKPTPAADVWSIDPDLETPDRLRRRIAQLAQDIATEAGTADTIESVNDGIGFRCRAPRGATDTDACPGFAWAILSLLYALSTGYRLDHGGSAPDALPLTHTIGALLLGNPLGDAVPTTRLSDESLCKLFRLVRLARRLKALDSDRPPHAEPATGR
ncbi:ParB family protein [Salinisphaera hydrothermalis]|uniref:Uncharacterized protein n=1 Tax=Salinisphaera hydrothermalis (strain C41B8) TaxID=1304275 RepID=A0A084IG07_SALHC|nr:ParB family protein [Salinisphaera hydrothermalis]KEZ75641.1 hypothetical protein C41B8_18977 [Salinisphaera hydrothermalis C41B8]